MKLNHHQKKVAAFALLFITINYFFGCTYYKPIAAEAYNDQTKQTSLRELNAQGKYFILRQGGYSYALTNVVLDETRMTLSAKPDQIPPEHSVYTSHKEKDKYKYLKSKGEGVVLTEVHIYTSDTSRVDTSLAYTFPLSNVKKIEMIEFDKKKSNASTAKGIVFTTIGAALLALTIVAATSEPDPPPPSSTVSSCPYISAYDGENYDLQGEIYSASIYQPLQKDDYLPMQLKTVNGDYNIKISNELQEIQHTDFADLLVVEHSKDVQLLVNPDGRIFSISNPVEPESATLNNNISIRNDLLKKDNYHCFFKDDNNRQSTEDLFITFTNDLKAKKGKLILSGKTSSWVNYLFGEFSKGFGTYYKKWAKEQEKKPAAELEKWSEEQNIPLTVSIKTANGWQELQKLKAVGPLLNRDMIIPVDLPENGPVEFKVSCGYLFWELDYVAMDYTPDADFTVNRIKPYMAVDEKGTNVLSSILNPDKQYLVQPEIGNAAILSYKSIAPKKGMTQSFFLHSSGYYTHIRNFKGSPKTAFLKSFEQPGALAAFSRQKFAEGMKSLVKK
ncbi:MAG TPA: hypothetical protein VF144_01950 [Chitinophagaceae bacterium]